MPAVVETNFHQPPTAASLLTAAPAVPAAAVVTLMASESPEAASIALMEVPAAPDHLQESRFVVMPPPSRAPVPITNSLVGDSTFINGAGVGTNSDTIITPHLASPWNGTLREHSRSPSLGDTFVSAAASSDMPYPSSSFTDSSDDSDTGLEGDEQQPEARLTDINVTRSELGYITTATITLSGSHSSPDAKTALTGIDQSNQDRRASPTNGNRPLVPMVPMETVTGGTFLPPPGHDAPSPSGSTSISLSMGSAGEDSTFRELNEPHISVKIAPEKKGLFLKHSEYEIKLKGAEKPVRRRYKDFVTLHGYLVEKYPYRMLPALPPKQLMLDSLLEERRRGLQAWLTIVSLHPVMGPSTIVGTFLRDSTTDYQYRMRVAYEKQMDEFARLRPEATLPREDVDTLIEARVRLHRVQGVVGRLKELLEEQTYRTERQVVVERTEIEHILQSAELRDAFTDGTFEDMAGSVRRTTRQCERYVRVQQRAVTERLHVLLEVLYAHSTLCERIEKGIFAEHQKALLKMATSGATGHGRVKTMTTTSNHTALIIPSDAMVSSPDQTLVARRSAFALSCARGETELAERYLHSLPSIMLSYAHEEQQHHQQMSEIWHRLVVNESGRLS